MRLTHIPVKIGVEVLNLGVVGFHLAALDPGHDGLGRHRRLRPPHVLLPEKKLPARVVSRHVVSCHVMSSHVTSHPITPDENKQWGEKEVVGTAGRERGRLDRYSEGALLLRVDAEDGESMKMRCHLPCD